jgi:hypothetical protein
MVSKFLLRSGLCHEVVLRYIVFQHAERVASRRRLLWLDSRRDFVIKRVSRPSYRRLSAWMFDCEASIPFLSSRSFATKSSSELWSARSFSNQFS